MSQRIRVSAIFDIDMITLGGSVTRATKLIQEAIDNIDWHSTSGDLEFKTYVVGFGPDPRMIDDRRR